MFVFKDLFLNDYLFLMNRTDRVNIKVFISKYVYTDHITVYKKACNTKTTKNMRKQSLSNRKQVIK